MCLSLGSWAQGLEKLYKNPNRAGTKCSFATGDQPIPICSGTCCESHILSITSLSSKGQLATLSVLSVDQHSGIATLEKVEEVCNRLVFYPVCKGWLSDIYCYKGNTSSENIILNSNLVDDSMYPEQTHPNFQKHHSANSRCAQTSRCSSRVPVAQEED